MKELNFLRLRNFTLLSEINGNSIHSVFLKVTISVRGVPCVYSPSAPKKNLATPLILYVFLHFSHHPSSINFSFDAKSVVAT